MDKDAMYRTSKGIRTLQEEVERLAARTIPMHMPGHKRGLRPSEALPYDLDITEIEGADDLHDASGILAEAMERAQGTEMISDYVSVTVDNAQEILDIAKKMQESDQDSEDIEESEDEQ